MLHPRRMLGVVSLIAVVAAAVIAFVPALGFVPAPKLPSEPASAMVAVKIQRVLPEQAVSVTVIDGSVLQAIPELAPMIQAADQRYAEYAAVCGSDWRTSRCGFVDSFRPPEKQVTTAIPRTLVPLLLEKMPPSSHQRVVDEQAALEGVVRVFDSYGIFFQYESNVYLLGMNVLAEPSG